MNTGRGKPPPGKGIRMIYTRIHSQKTDGTYCGDWLFAGGDPLKALDRFFREYPAHRHNRITIEPFDPDENEAARGLYKAMKECDCVYTW